MNIEIEVKCRPILFSGPMIRALLENRKTQTRRIIKPQPRLCGEGWWVGEGIKGIEPDYFADDDSVSEWYFHTLYADRGAPHGSVWADGRADRMWVRETWVEHMGVGGLSGFCADGYEPTEHWERKRPSIFMPRWASRITLEIKNVRVERLQDISHADALAEGVPDTGAGTYGFPVSSYAIANYRLLWESINGPGSWGANPWCWVYDFKRIQESSDAPA